MMTMMSSQPFFLRMTLAWLILLPFTLPFELKAAQGSPASQNPAWSAFHPQVTPAPAPEEASPRRWDPSNWRPWVKILVYAAAIGLAFGLGWLSFVLAINFSAFLGLIEIWLAWVIIGVGVVVATWLSSGAFHVLKGVERGWRRWLSRLLHLLGLAGLAVISFWGFWIPVVVVLLVTYFIFRPRE